MSWIPAFSIPVARRVGADDIALTVIIAPAPSTHEQYHSESVLKVLLPVNKRYQKAVY